MLKTYIEYNVAEDIFQLLKLFFCCNSRILPAFRLHVSGKAGILCADSLKNSIKEVFYEKAVVNIVFSILQYHALCGSCPAGGPVHSAA